MKSSEDRVATNKLNWFYGVVGISMALVSLFLSLWLLWVVSSHFLTFLENANPSVSASVIGGMTTVLAAIGAALFTQAQIKKRELDEAHREKKVQIYYKFLEMLQRSITKNNPYAGNQGPSEKEIVRFILGFKTDLILWGSPKVINALIKFERVKGNSEENILVVTDELYRAIREDIGLNNKGLNNYQLIKINLANPNELDEMLAAQRKKKNIFKLSST